MNTSKIRVVFSLLMSIILIAHVAPMYATAGSVASGSPSSDSILQFPSYPDTGGTRSIAGFKRDSQGKSHILYQQQYQGIPVYGKYAYVHKTAANQIYATSDKFDHSLASLALDVTPVLTAADAIDELQLFLEDRHGQPVQFGSGEEAFPIDPPTAELVIYPQDGQYYLAYQVEADYIVPTVGSWTAFVDAKDGRMIHSINKVRHVVSPVEGSGTGTYGELPLEVGHNHDDNLYYMLDATRDMYDEQPVDLERYLDFSSGVVEEQGLIITMDYADLQEKHDNMSYELKPVSSTTSTGFMDTHAVDAHYWAGEVYEFYLEQFERNSIDGNGMDLVSFVHVPDIDLDTEQEVPLDNAFWSSGAMWYGDGAEQFDCLSCANDIVAHELTHGVIEHTANLNYEYQSGALNESIADIMAVVFDTDDWTIGEDAAAAPLRDFANPHNGGQPMHMDEYVNLPNTENGDYGGVHVNSGIPNHAAYLMATRMDNASYNGRSLLGQLTYHALTHYLHPASDFMDARLAYLEAVDSLSVSAASKSEIKQIVKSAWEDVGVRLSPDPYMFAVDHYYNEDNGRFPFYFNTSVTESVYYDDITVNDGDTIVPIETTVEEDTLWIQPIDSLTHSVTYDVYVPAGAFTDQLGDPNLYAATVSFTADKVGPSWSSNALTSSHITESRFRISWPHATDDHGVFLYAVYVNDYLWNVYSPDVRSVLFNGLEPGTTYTVDVVAYDEAGNYTVRTKSVKTNNAGGGLGGGFGGGGWFGPVPAEDDQETAENGESIITVKPDEQRIQQAIASDDSTISIDAKAESRVDTVIVELPTDLVKQANAKQKSWTIETNEASFSFDPGFVLDGQLSGTLVFTIHDTTADGALDQKQAHSTAVAPVYDLQLKINDRTIATFQKPVKISMDVRAQASPLHTLGAYYYNERQRKWEYIGGKLSANGRVMQFETDHFSQYTVMAYHRIFDDIQGHWAQVDIETMAGRHVAQGVSESAFAPNTPITRAAFTALLVRTLQLEEQSEISFSDVPADSWYGAAVNIAYTAGIVNGIDADHFAPSARITREQMAVMIIQAYAEANNIDPASLLSTGDVEFPDIATASDWAKPSINAAASLQLISGRTNGSFDPGANASRAEAIAIIKRLMDQIE